MISKLVPRQPDPRIKKASDQEIAKFGHLNWLVEQINLVPPGSGIISVVGGTDITIDNTDPLNPVINFTGSGGGENLAQTLAIGSDANSVPITGFATLEGAAGTDIAIFPITGGAQQAYFGIDSGAGVQAIATYIGGNGTTIGDIKNFGARVEVGIGGNIVNMKATTLYTPAGSGPSALGTYIGLSTDRVGFYKVSATQANFCSSGAEASGWNTTGLLANNITEFTSGAGVTVAGAFLSIPVYADGTARDAAIPAPALGMIIAITDNGVGTQQVQAYTSGAWKDMV